MKNKPDLENPKYRQLLQAVHNDTPGLHLLSLVDIRSGHIYALPDDAAIEQAMLACTLFAGQAPEQLEHFDAIGDWELACFRIGKHQLLAVSQEADDATLTIVAFPDHAEIARLRQLLSEVKSCLSSGKDLTALTGCRQIARAWTIDKNKKTLLDSYKRAGTNGSDSFRVLDELDPVTDLLPLIQSLGNHESARDRPWLDAVMAASEGRVLRWMRTPFIVDHVLFTDSPGSVDDHYIVSAMKQAQNDLLRQMIADILASGLKTLTEPFPETDTDFAGIVRTLRALDRTDLEGRLIEGGFANRPQTIGGTHMRCQECIYFLPNRRWCDLPELPIPVEPDWYCRLWKM